MMTFVKSFSTNLPSRSDSNNGVQLSSVNRQLSHFELDVEISFATLLCVSKFQLTGKLLLRNEPVLLKLSCDFSI